MRVSKKQIFIPAALLLGAVLFLIYTYPVPEHHHDSHAREGLYDDHIHDIEQLSDNFSEVVDYFVSVAEEKGSVYAFDLLINAPNLPQADAHLIGHEIGATLYAEYGFEGMKHCTHDLRNACSHAVVIGALLEEGEVIFDTVNDICRGAPGGTGAYSMCFHGLGHGLLAYSQYEIPEAVALCGKIKNETIFGDEEKQCIGGIIMEMNIGAHNPSVWAEKKKQYLSKDDPLRICQADYMPESAKSICYLYVTPYIFEAVEFTGGNVTSAQFSDGFEYCDGIEHINNRQSCYGGMGKEFVSMAQGGDTRIDTVATDDELHQIVQWCNVAEKDEARISCVRTALDTLYWGGENNPDTSLRFCGLVEEAEARQECFEHLVTLTMHYQTLPEAQKKMCQSIAREYEDLCTDDT